MVSAVWISELAAVDGAVLSLLSEVVACIKSLPRREGFEEAANYVCAEGNA